MSSGPAIVEGEVRELVRRRGIDPVAEPAVVRRLIDEVVGEYLDRAVTSSLPPLGDPAQVSRAVLDAVAGFGPLQPFLDDRTIEEIWINEPGRVFVARRGRSELTTLILSAGQVAELVERMLRTSGRRIDLSTPFVDAQLNDGSRLHVAIPPVTLRHMAVNIRKFVLGLHSLDELMAAGSLTEQACRFLEASVAAGLNVLVSGGTQVGKTTDEFGHTTCPTTLPGALVGDDHGDTGEGHHEALRAVSGPCSSRRWPGWQGLAGSDRNAPF
jgi:pilus assembly protein CpaF